MKINEGIAAIGRTGSGKSTLIRWLARQHTDKQFLWFTAKPDETEVAKEILPKAELLSDLRFNVLAYEMGRKGGSAMNMATILQDVNEVISRSNKKGEAFWETHFTVATMHAINVVWLVKGKDATLAHVYHFLMTTPESRQPSEEFKKSFCYLTLNAASNLYPTDERVGAALDYFLEMLPASGEKVRGAVISQATNVLLPFTIPPLAGIFSGESSYTPDDPRQIVLDYDILTHGKVGQIAQLLMSFMKLEAQLRDPKPKPCIFMRDEYQYYCHPGRDIKAQTVARSQQFTSVIAFQTLPVLVDGLGGGYEAKTQAQALYACHVNKFILNNNCPETNEINSKILGMDRQLFFSSSTNPNQQREWWDILGVGARPSVSMSQQYHYRVPPATFTTLKTGGLENKKVVEAIYHDGFNYQKVSVKQ